MIEVVLDASVLVAALSPREVHHRAARESYDAHPESRAFLVPSVFRLEVVAALARRGESDELLDIVAALVSGPRFHSVDVDSSLLELATRVARTAKLRAYDAVYAALALSSDAALLTLDSEMSSRLARAFPKAKIALPGAPRPRSRPKAR